MGYPETTHGSMLLGLLSMVLAQLAPSPALAETITGQVIAIQDGDTLSLLDSQNQQHRIRLSEIDAPESRQAFGQRSKQSLAELAYGQWATAECPSRDRYGRLICAITVGNTQINIAQVQRGMAWAYTMYAHDPRVFEAQREARAARRGLWASETPVPPWDWRKEQKR